MAAAAAVTGTETGTAPMDAEDAALSQQAAQLGARTIAPKTRIAYNNSNVQFMQWLCLRGSPFLSDAFYAGTAKGHKPSAVYCRTFLDVLADPSRPPLNFSDHETAKEFCKWLMSLHLAALSGHRRKEDYGISTYKKHRSACCNSTRTSKRRYPPPSDNLLPTC